VFSGRENDKDAKYHCSRLIRRLDLEAVALLVQNLKNDISRFSQRANQSDLAKTYQSITANFKHVIGSSLSYTTLQDCLTYRRLHKATSVNDLLNPWIS
jgi:hypothetical protein